MLFKETITPSALALLKKLCMGPLLQAFALGGGTGLALQRGHRISVDLDFFTNQPFNNADIYKYMAALPEKTELLFEQNQTMMFLVDDIKVDFVLYPFAWLQPFVIIENCRLIHQDDIIPMKLQAVSNRFAKKDFYDIEALLSDYTLSEILRLFTQKFPDIDTGFLIHSLTHFDEAEKEEDPVLLPTSHSWEQVKQNLQNTVRTYTLKDE